MKNYRAAGLLMALGLLSHFHALATDIYRGPIQTLTTAKPNVIIGLEDNGFMDKEILLKTNYGQFVWDDRKSGASGLSGSGWDSNGTPLIYDNMPFVGNPSVAFFSQLFANGCGIAQMVRCYLYGASALAPTNQFASLRSKDYNALYYDPAISYQPWKNFGNSPGTAALSHPLYGVPTDLTANVLADGEGYVFSLRAGMTVPAGTFVYWDYFPFFLFDTHYLITTGTWSVPSDGRFYAAVLPYFPATYWIKQSCTVDNNGCAQAPDGATLKRYEIKPGNAFPSGRTYAAELQNFANWFTYHRKLKLALAASMEDALTGLSGMRVGVVNMAQPSAPTMVDLDSEDPALSRRVILNTFYEDAAYQPNSLSPPISYIGKQFQNNPNIVQSGCQRNAALILTNTYEHPNVGDFAPAYNASKWGSGSHYQPTLASTLADYALSYYSNNLRPDLTPGQVPSTTPTALNPDADNNPDPHMNTYIVSWGMPGRLWQGSSSANAGNISWPAVRDTTDKGVIDDLWHATVNGRGSMATVSSPAETTLAIRNALNQIRQQSFGQAGESSGTAGVAFSTLNLKASSTLAYVGSYRPLGSSGDVTAYAVDLTTGALATTPSWSADSLLQARDYRTRAIGSFNGTIGVKFDAAAVGGLLNPGSVNGVTADLVAYLRGNRSLEGSTFRARTGAMGAVVNAEPVSLPSEGVLFVTSNDGMVHALAQSSGQELWAYVPGFALANVGSISQKTWQFQTVLDATPSLGKVNGHTLLVGGRGSAGTGFYALDVTNAKGTIASASESPSDTSVAARVLWEFPSRSTPLAVVNSLGVSLGRPVIVETRRYGPVVVLSSGYNSATDGHGRVFVLNAMTGALLKVFVTTAGSLGAGDAGLAQIAALAEADGTVNYLYGGDLLGNLWRFSLESDTVMRLATLADGNGTPQPITATPELSIVNGRHMVFVGTGRLLGQTDLADTKTQTLYAIWDNNATVFNSRVALAMRSMSVVANKRSVSGSAIDWGTQQGWYVDLPAGEKINTDPSIAYGVLAFTSNNPSPSSCSVSSALYLANVGTGLPLADAIFPVGLAQYGVQFSGTLTGRASIARLPTGAIVVTTHQSDNSTKGLRLSPGANAKPVKAAWKAVSR